MAESFPVPSLLIGGITAGWQSCMNVTCEFSPIADSAHVVRSWNGTPLNLADSAFKMYRVVLSCDGDMLSPTLMHLWPGTRFTMIPPEEFAEPTGYPQQRPAYGSVRTVDRHFVVGGGERRFYRPILDMYVTEPWRVTANEREKSVSWQLTAEEYQIPAGYGG
jgi:hypothetical protein